MPRSENESDRGEFVEDTPDRIQHAAVAPTGGEQGKDATNPIEVNPVENEPTLNTPTPTVGLEPGVQGMEGRPALTPPARPDDPGALMRNILAQIQELRSTIQAMSQKVHQATSSTPELEQILEKNQKTPFAVHISNVSVRHDNKIKLKSYEGNTDPQQFLSSFSVATQRDHFHPSEAEVENRLDQYCDFHKRSGHSTAACRHLQSILLNKYKKGDIEVQHRQYKSHNNTYAARGGRDGNNVFHRLGPHTGRQQEAPPANEEERHPDMEPPKKNRENDQQHNDAPVPRRRVNMIMGGLTACRDSFRSIKEYIKSGAATLWSSPATKEMTPLTFTSEDLFGVDLPHNDPLVIELHIGESEVTRILIDTGSSVNVVFKDVLQKMKVHDRHIKPSVRPLTGFDGNTMMTNGTIKLPIYLGGAATWHKFVVVDKPTIYNIILGTPWIHDMQAIPSSYHQCIKIPTSIGIETIRGNQNLAHDMVGIDPEVACHELNVDPTFKLVKQKRRKLGPERSKAVNDEVDKLLDAGSIVEVKYPEWLANPVVVKKKNDKWRVCIDFTDLNKACPKDSFPLPHIDRMVEATTGNELLSFMDAFSGYNQIPMHKDDQEKTSFIIDRGTYCYKVMPFGLKNVGARYQRLVNQMFAPQLGKTMEVYIDDMLVKSTRSADHIDHLKACFETLNKYNMKLNPAKCLFGVTSGEFLGYIVTKRGIEANPKQIRAILDLQSPRNKKEVQRLTGRIAGLNRFIARSTDKSLPFYQLLRSANKTFE
uniref:Putative retroelement pol polyprotein n=1 Tax=Arabidopsis thaliana TaxID=3702 RepID=Q9ZQ67_ARATH|nr:putative retroelement pol polyprotein [Arabidopsis thaliana]